MATQVVVPFNGVQQMALGGPREQQKHVPEVVAARHCVATIHLLTE